MDDYPFLNTLRFCRRAVLHFCIPIDFKGYLHAYNRSILDFGCDTVFSELIRRKN